MKYIRIFAYIYIISAIIVYVYKLTDLNNTVLSYIVSLPYAIGWIGIPFIYIFILISFFYNTTKYYKTKNKVYIYNVFHEISILLIGGYIFNLSV